MTEPCENCGTPVRLIRGNGDDHPTPWEHIGGLPTRFHSDGAPANRTPMFAPHTPDRCQSARRHRQETR